MFLTLGSRNIRAVPALRDVVHNPMCSHDGSGISLTRWSVTSTSLVNAGPHWHEDDINVAVEGQPRWSIREVLLEEQLHLYHYSRNASLFLDDRVLRLLRLQPWGAHVFVTLNTFRHLTATRLSRKLNASGHMLYYISYLLFLTLNRTVQSMCANFVSSCILWLQCISCNKLNYVSNTDC